MIALKVERSAVDDGAAADRSGPLSASFCRSASGDTAMPELWRTLMHPFASVHFARTQMRSGGSNCLRNRRRCSARAKLAPAAKITGKASAQRAGALQVNRRLSSGREWAVANDDYLWVPADTDFVADGSRDILHQRLEILAFDAGLEVRKPVRRIGG
ncbi:MAG: hypothetical protein E6J82_16255 [Deltaproteobacteria bacterium]|nr:MAG: hypothetical protein E6J82_16255 [Deltaproteobacteria bacterium]